MNEIISIYEWMAKHRLVNEKGEPISFDDHMFLLEPYGDFTREQVYKKAAQIGMTTCMLMKEIYAADQLRLGAIHTLPSDSDVWEMVPTKVDKIFMNNPSLRKMLQTDKTEMKQISDRFIHFKGTRSKAAPIMTTTDILVKDEKDRSDQNILGQYDSRVGKSQYKGIWELSNPSVSKAGVDLTWRRSDQKEWVITCLGCKTEQQLRWDKNVDQRKGVYICANCGRMLTDYERRIGKWIPKNPGSDISGYHISQMMAPWITAKELVREYETKDPEYFNNFVLGEVADGEGITDFRRIILDAWTPNPIDRKPYILGIDVGKVKHWVLGSQDGIFKIGKCESREEIEGLIERYNPTVVMDAGPERTWAEEFRRKYPKFYINFYHRDKDKKDLVRFGEDKEVGIIWSDRNRVIDAVATDMAIGEVQFDLPAKDLENYIKHWEAMVRKREEDALGMDRYVWEKAMPTSADHWAHATVYWWIGRRKVEATKVLPGKREKVQFIERTTEGFKMKDVEEYLDSKHG